MDAKVTEAEPPQGQGLRPVRMHGALSNNGRTDVETILVLEGYPKSMPLYMADVFLADRHAPLSRRIDKKKQINNIA
jgi:hypothetical protein